MADVSIGPPDGDRLREADRGQLLIVAGLVMAVSLVALVVLLNATIYSENVATRGVEAADGEATEMRATAVEGVGELLDAANRENAAAGGPRTASQLANEVIAPGIGDLDERMGRASARRGGVASVDGNASRTTPGWYLDTAGTNASLANETNASTTLATDVDRTRGFVLDLDAGSLANATTGDAESDAFHVVLNASAPNETREAYVYRNDGDVVVAAGRNGTEPTVRCRAAAADRVTVDLTSGRVTSVTANGSTVERVGCPGVWPGDLVTPANPYDVEYANADAASGSATATVESSVDQAAEHEYAYPAVYDAVVDVRYRTADLRFETTVRVAPGEPDG